MVSINNNNTQIDLVIIIIIINRAASFEQNFFLQKIFSEEKKIEIEFIVECFVIDGGGVYLGTDFDSIGLIII